MPEVGRRLSGSNHRCVQIGPSGETDDQSPAIPIPLVSRTPHLATTDQPLKFPDSFPTAVVVTLLGVLTGLRTFWCIDGDQPKTRLTNCKSIAIYDARQATRFFRERDRGGADQRTRKKPAHELIALSIPDHSSKHLVRRKYD
jgi:hypothetical protein